MQPIKLIAIYARVSTSTQEEEQTIQNQIHTLKEYAERHNCKIIQEYLDDGWSGDTLARPALDNLRQDAKNKIWQGVLIYDPDRLARRYSYQELVMDELTEAGIEVMFVTVPTAKSVDERMMNGVRGLFAEYERVKISERFRLGKLRRVREGKVLVSEGPYGYKYVPKSGSGHGHFEIDENEARVVRLMFTWLVEEGLTLRKIILRLQELSISPRKSRKGVWATSTLSTLFRNKTYIGEAHWGATYAVVPENPTSTAKYKKVKKTSRRNKPESEWTIIPVPALLDKELFDKAQKQLEYNFSMCQRHKKSEYLVAGKIYCNCGLRRTGEGLQKGKHLYYRCNNRVMNFPLPKTCHEAGVNARKADEAIWKKVAELMTSPTLMSKQVERWMKKKYQESSVPSMDQEVIKAEMEKIKKQEDRYNQAFASDLLTLDQLKEYIIPLKARAQSLTEQLASTDLIPQQSYINPSKENISAFSEEAKKALIDLSFEKKRAIILSIVDKIIGNKEKLTIQGHIPINNYEFFPKRRHRGPTKRRKINPI